MITIERAYELRAMIERAAAMLPDEDALEAVELFPTWAVDSDYWKGDRVRDPVDGLLYKLIVETPEGHPHHSQIDWPPHLVPAIWTRCAEPGVIPVWVQPTGAHDAYNKGDPVHYPDAAGPVYRSTIDGNVWSPDAYPDGWEIEADDDGKAHSGLLEED